MPADELLRDHRASGAMIAQGRACRARWRRARRRCLSCAHSQETSPCAPRSPSSAPAPSGLLLGQLLHQAGIDNVILERQSGDYVLGRIRAGVLEQVTVDLLDEAGVGAAPARARACVHDGIELVFEGARHRIDVQRPHRRQGGHGLRPDRGDARPDGGARGRGPGHRLRGRRRQPARLRRRHARACATARTAQTHELDCDFIAGCDGFHGVSRASVPGRASPSTRRSTPSAGWACWPTCRRCRRTPSSTATASAASRCARMRSLTRSRYYVQCPLDDKVEDWSDERFWDELRRRLDPEAARAPRHRPVASRRASRRCAASWPSRCASAGCSWPATRRTSCRPPAPRA